MRSLSAYALTFSLLGTLGQAPGGAAAGGDIRALERATWQAYKEKDASGYRRLLASGYVNVGGDGIFGLEKELRDMPRSGVESYALSDMTVSFPAPNVAVVTYVVSVVRAGELPRHAVPFYDASVWVRSEGTWKTVLHTHARKEQ